MRDGQASIRAERAGEAPVDVASLVFFRICLGALLVVAVVRHWSKGGIHDAFVAPKFFFPYDGFGWLTPLPGNGMYAVYAAIGLLAIAFAAGAWFRVVAPVLCALFTYAHLADKSNYLNHYYLVSLLLFLASFVPLHAAGSVDAWRAAKRGHVPARTFPAWILWLFRFQVGLVYFFGGVAKLKADWLLRGLPLRIWLAAAGDFPILGPILRWPETAYAMSWLGAAFDLSVAFLLCFRKTRPFAFVCGAVFHVMTARLFQIGMFPWIMIANALLFFPPDWPRAILRRVGAIGKSERVKSAPADAPGGSTPGASHEAAGSPMPLRLLVVWAAIQILVPLRHWLYPGNLLWTENAYRFSWNVMLVEKTGWAEFTLRDPKTGATRLARPRDELTPFQIKMMSTQPDMLVAYARHLADRAEARGETRPEVHADVEVVLNGRPPAPFVDPRVDLAAVSDGPFSARRWLLPAPP